MQLAGITAATRDPEGGRILRDADGNPTGVFIDAAMDLVERVYQVSVRPRSRELP